MFRVKKPTDSAKMMSKPRTQKSVSIRDKYNAIMDLQKGMKNNAVAAKYGVPKNTVSTWKKNSAKVIAANNSTSTAPKRRRIRAGQHEDLDTAVLKWFQYVRDRHVPINGKVIQEKALQYAKELEIENFHASDGWLDRWKKRNSISFKVVAGESASVTEEMVAPWTETTLPTILSQFKAEDIYNVDECGLFYQALPNRSLHLSKEKCHGGKQSKVRITVLCGANAVGDKLPLFIIGKSKQPRCFKGVRNLPCRYRHQKKSWMDAELFTEWLQEFDRTISADGRKVALLVDNCPAHPHVDGLQSVTLVFLPPNTTSKTQPMDQGVIRTLKAYYRTQLVQRALREIDIQSNSSTIQMPRISILDAMLMLKVAWRQVKESTITACFCKAGINESATNSSDDNPFADLQEGMQELQSIQPELVPATVTPEEWVNSDADVETGTAITDEDIIQEYQRTRDADANSDEDSDDGFEVHDEPQPPPSIKEVQAAMDVMQRYSLYLESTDVAIQITKACSSIDAAIVQQKKQAKITDYFASTV